MKSVRLPIMTVIAAAAAGAVPHPAQAGVLSASDILSQFNAVIFDTFSSSADVEGRTVVGGNLTGGATFNLNPKQASASSFSGLTVYGSATGGGSYNINKGGGVTIAGSNATSFNLNSGGSAYIGGANTGNLNGSSGTSSVTIGGANSGSVQTSGGNLYIGRSNSGGIATSGSATVAINGNNSANVNVNGSGSVSLNGSNSGTISLNGGTYTYTGQKGNANLNGGAMATQVGSLTLTAPANPLPAFASTFQTPLTNLSTQLNALAANSVANASNGAITFNARPDSSGTAIFDISSSLLQPNSLATMNLNGATSVIINVTVAGCVSGACAFSLPNSLNFANPTSYAAHVLWNFANAIGLSIPNEIGGSILAPLAAVSNNAPIDGTLVAASYSGSGELHTYPFSGTLPDGLSGLSVATVLVSEPASLALIAGGLPVLAAFRRRRSHPATPGGSGQSRAPAP
jgi:choice-of-anchor A domain-containing protein